jgi:hypothetical protein
LSGRVLALAALALLLGFTTARAQDPPKARRPQRPHRTGLWSEVAAGGGFLRMGCSTCTDPIETRVGGGLFRLGGTVNDRVMLAWESIGLNDQTFSFAAGDSTTVADFGTATIIVLWFPGRSGLFLKGGVGIVSGTFQVPSGTAVPDSAEGVGIGMTLGLGWDLPISRKFALTANAASFISAIGDIVLPTRRVDDVIGSAYQFTVGVTFR